MPKHLAFVAFCVASLFALRELRAAGEPPAWAYAIPQPAPVGAAPTTADTSLTQIPGSPLRFTRQQIGDGFGPADWFPGDHPEMPEIVAHGRQPDVRACALCHYPNGKGRAENAGIAGLPGDYFIRQMNDFRSGARKSAEPRKTNTNIMIAIAKAMTPAEIKETAAYFAAMPWTPWIRVVETDTVAKTISRGGLWVPLEGNEKEPLGVRIIETPENPERTDLRDPRSGFVAYVPVGSIKKGEALVVRGGDGRTVECSACHGANLVDGAGSAPGIGGRSPSYLVRQLYDMQAAARRSDATTPMRPVVSKLTDEDFVNIAAYLADLLPPTAGDTP